jgi:glycosyltransferase involved in cell wall biosynthesis
VALFHGVFSYDPNECAALFLMRRVAPLVQRHLPSWRIRIVGRAPTTAIREEASRCRCVEVIADAPDMTEHLSTASIGVYPVFMRTGIQNKVLEALAHGLPVVTTAGVKDVFTRFDPAASSCILAARSGRDFARRMGKLAGAPDLRQRMSAAGRKFVARSFAWEGAVNRLLDI